MQGGPPRGFLEMRALMHLDGRSAEIAVQRSRRLRLQLPLEALAGTRHPQNLACEGLKKWGLGSC